MRYQFSKIIQITDSEIARAQIQKKSYRFNTFFGSNIAEIQSKTESVEWYWVPSKENNADLTTRECNPFELGPESVWQKGSNFLYKNFSDWLVKQNPVSDLPDVVFARISLNTGETITSNQLIDNQLIDIQRFSNMKRLLSVMARVMNGVRRR